MEGNTNINSSGASNTETQDSIDTSKRKSADVGWEYGELVLPNSYDKIKCKLCDKSFSGGIYRLKQHVACIRGNVKACPKATPLDKSRCLQALEGSKKKKQDKKDHVAEVREDVSVSQKIIDVEDDFEGTRPPRSLGPMDQFARAFSPLHLAGYLLNPYYYYRDDEAKKDPACMAAILTCIEAFFPNDFRIQNLVCNSELLKYKNMEGMFSKKLAIMGRMTNDENFDVVGWWSNYGAETPNLQTMAIKILSLTSSSSGCERNWSNFEGIHTKKRNRLDSARLSHLVYVQFNSKLVNKKKKMKDKCDVLLATDASMAQGWIVEGGDDDDDLSTTSTITGEDIGGETENVLSSTTATRMVRELDEDNFQSEDEAECNEDLVFYDSDHQGW